MISRVVKLSDRLGSCRPHRASLTDRCCRHGGRHGDKTPARAQAGEEQEGDHSEHKTIVARRQSWVRQVPQKEGTCEGRHWRLGGETELLGFTASGHPLDLHPNVAWKTYCPIHRLGDYVGQEVVVCGLIIEQRVHHQVTGEPMKFMTLCDPSGMVETELFAQTYKSYGLATIRYPVLEVEARVEPYENNNGFSLRVLRAGKPRTKTPCPPTLRDA